ncbi:MAG: pilus assembly protein CpaD [Alphaproteobacteria bacterium]|nr:pilus assembly protein CpaD [Alphaproteobacteria bacterium]
MTAAGIRGLLFAALAFGLAACDTTGDVTGSVDSDYRKRHPISIGEGNRSLAVHVGAGRGGLTPVQRAEVLAFAQSWKREATGGITIERPVGGPNERAANDTLKEALSIMVQSGVPNHGIGIRPYQAGGSKVAPLRLNYPQIAAHAGPCGQWPDDPGPSPGARHFENRQYHNFGCSTQRNFAAMVAEPADLVQPRAETAAYTNKRTFAREKWRKGESPATIIPDTQKGAISDLGK